MTHRIDKVVRVARWLAEHEVPAIRLMPGVPAPVRVEGHLATVWVDACPRPGHGSASPPGADDLAVLLRRLHPLTAPPPLPAWDPLDDVHRRLSDAEALPAPDRRFLTDQADRVAAALAGVRYALPPAVVHGDAHLGNLVGADDGQVLLCDFDATCHGPAEWDLVPLAVGWLRFGDPAARYARLAEGYGFDVTRWDGFEVLRAVRELKLVTSVVPILASSPSAAAQFRVRIDSLRRGRDSVRWSRYR
jgi:aminoglycoside phosphotransferase (APT) family kinase protein